MVWLPEIPRYNKTEPIYHFHPLGVCNVHWMCVDILIISDVVHVAVATSVHKSTLLPTLSH